MTHFLKSDTGAVTVDWVVLTAGLVGLGLATMGVVSSGVEDLSGDVDRELAGHVIKTSFAPNYTPFDQSLYDTHRDLNIAKNESGAYTRTEASVAYYEKTFRTNAMYYIGVGSQTNANNLLDQARGAEAAAWERGATLDTDGPTYAELQTAYDAEFGS